MIIYKNVQPSPVQDFLFISWFITEPDCRRLPYLVPITINSPHDIFLHLEKIETIIISPVSSLQSPVIQTRAGKLSIENDKLDNIELIANFKQNKLYLSL